MKYQVIYLNGTQRYHGGQYDNRKDARAEARILREDGWKAWVEPWDDLVDRRRLRSNWNAL